MMADWMDDVVILRHENGMVSARHASGAPAENRYGGFVPGQPRHAAMRWTDRPSCEAPPVPVYDLSPLANLATAVAWGLALERVVTEWRAWHPAARVSWDVNSGPCAELRMSYGVDGIGLVLDVVRELDGWRAADGMADALEDAKVHAALAMAPHYVAPAPKPANRDAALRRFADGVSR